MRYSSGEGHYLDRVGVRMGEEERGGSVRCLDLACQPRPGPGRHCPTWQYLLCISKRDGGAGTSAIASV